MPPKPMSETRIREIIHDQFATSMKEFMANMNNGACGSGGASEEMDNQEFCPRSVIQRLEQELYNLRMKGIDIDGYTNRFHELALLCPRMVEPEAVKVKQYLWGLTKSIRGDVTSSQSVTINDAVHLAYQLVVQMIQDKADEETGGEKRKGEGDRGGRGDNQREHNRRQNQKEIAGSAQSVVNWVTGVRFQKCDITVMRRVTRRRIALSRVEMGKEEIIVDVLTSWGLPPQSVTTDPRHVSGFTRRADMCMR
nr:hypothetical protein [Tanacetum cinerariifolium]